MEASELDKAVEYTKQFIEAATPIAKRAYDIGLVTLRIDAAQSIVFAVAMLIAAIFIVRRVRSDWSKAEAADEYLPADGVPHVLASIFAAIGGIYGVAAILNVWLWMKLVSPELWLAHRAIEKIVG